MRRVGRSVVKSRAGSVVRSVGRGVIKSVAGSVVRSVIRSRARDTNEFDTCFGRRITAKLLALLLKAEMLGLHMIDGLP